MKYIALALGCALLAACAEAPSVSRSTADIPDWAVTDVQVSVPGTLTVSENPKTRFPDTDVVWWEDPAGDRRAQVAGLVDDAASRLVTSAAKARVTLDIEVIHFHAVTPMARSGGFFSWHDIALDVAVLDAATGETVQAAERVDVRLNAFAGGRAERAEARGETQRVRISRAIEAALGEYLAAREG